MGKKKYVAKTSELLVLVWCKYPNSFVFKTLIICTFCTAEAFMLFVAIYLSKTEYSYHWRHQIGFVCYIQPNTFCKYFEMMYINLYSNIILIILQSIRFDVLPISSSKWLRYTCGSSTIPSWFGPLLLTWWAQFGMMILGNTIGQNRKHKILLGIFKLLFFSIPLEKKLKKGNFFFLIYKETNAHNKTNYWDKLLS